MYKHLIFDLDGTIVDTLPSIIKSINLTLKHFKAPYQYTIKDGPRLVGWGTPYLVKTAFKDENCDYEKIVKYYLPTQAKVHLKQAKLFPGIKETLATLKKRGYILYIATNKPIEVGPPTINKLYGKDFFKDASYQKLKTPKKPDPYVVNEIIKRNHLKRKECLYIGDSEVDIATAKNAKIDCLLVTFGYGRYKEFDVKKAKFIINKPQELLNYLK
ncbi:MAG: HAD family hydrolase [Bacilli bacterium]|nr:HAD family hydrolase [Bacilli bacterium]